jgi:hypothetical protein
MDLAYVSALSALAGSVVGGFTAGASTWLSYRAQARAGRLAYDLSRRQNLLREFIVAASKVYTNALVSTEPKLDKLVELYSMISRMRVICLPETVACAVKIMITTVDRFFAPNKTMQDLHVLIKSGSGIDPLKEFSDAAREELQAFG